MTMRREIWMPCCTVITDNIWRSVVSRVPEGCLEKLVEVKKLCELPDGPYMYGELTEAESEQLERLTACKDLKEQAAKVPAVTFAVFFQEG